MIIMSSLGRFECTHGGTVILPSLALQRTGDTETDVVVPVVGLVPVAIGGAEVLWIVVPRTAPDHTRLLRLRGRWRHALHRDPKVVELLKALDFNVT